MRGPAERRCYRSCWQRRVRLWRRRSRRHGCPAARREDGGTNYQHKQTAPVAKRRSSALVLAAERNGIERRGNDGHGMAVAPFPAATGAGRGQRDVTAETCTIAEVGFPESSTRTPFQVNVRVGDFR